MRGLILSLVFAAAVCCAQGKTEFGTLQGAEFRIDVPENWNHSLVVYYHGYDAEDHGVAFDQKKPLSPMLAVFPKAGFALIQSGYTRGGWALEQAIPETEALRQYFVDHYGTPRDTYVAGESMGGMLTVMTLEQSPEHYAAGLDLCGAVRDTASLMMRAFDLRILFDYYFPRLLPDPSKVPATYEISDALAKEVAGRLVAKPAAAASLRRFGELRTNKDLVDDLLFGTWVLKDIEQRAGGNPFDNRSTIYNGTGNDNLVNDKVKRYMADPGALTYLQRYYAPTGHLSRPVLAIHTTYDPLVSPSVPGLYAQLTRNVGTDADFVVQYVKHDGHCNFTPSEIESGFSELRQWKKKGIAPMPGKLP